MFSFISQPERSEIRKPSRRRLARVEALAGLLLLFLAAEPALSESCVVSASYSRVAVSDLQLPGEDVRVRLLDLEPQSSSLSVSLEDQQGQRLDTVFVPPREEAEVEVVFSGALAKALERDLSYRVLVEDEAGKPLMDPYPFLVTLECVEGMPCSYRPINGFETEALLVTVELERALAESPPCQLSQNLQNLKSSRPDLLRDIQTLEHQLGRLEIGSGCAYAWQVVVSPLLNDWLYYLQQIPSTVPEVEIQGVEAGAQLCYGMQMRHLPSSPSNARTFLRKGVTEVEVSTVCVSGKLCGPCAGEVEITADFSVCSAVDVAVPCENGSATAEASAQTTYDVDSAAPFSPLIVATKARATAIYGDSAWWNAQWKTESNRSFFDAPVTARVASSEVLTTTVNGPSSSSAETCAEEEWSSAAFALSDASNLFWLTADATSSCTLNPTATTRVEPPKPAGPTLDGGLKLKRWRDHPGGDG